MRFFSIYVYMTKTAKRQLKKNNTKKMKGGGLFGDAPVNNKEKNLDDVVDDIENIRRDETSLNKLVDDTSIRNKLGEKKTMFDRLKGIFSFTTSKNENGTEQQNTLVKTTQGGRRRNTKKATRKAKKAGRIAKKGARKANKSRRTRK